MELRLMKFLIIFAILNLSECFLTKTKQNLIKSLNKELNIKHLNIMKDLDFQINHKILLFVKNLSQQKIYASAMSAMQINHSLHEYYYTSSMDFQYAHQTGDWSFFNIKQRLVYPPKTLVIIYGNNLKEIISYIFTVRNEILSSKFIWLIVDKFNESLLNTKEYYIPYNSQLFILKKFTDKENNYLIKEFYHPSQKTITCFNRHFGVWEENQGLEIFQNIYERRFDMNGTIITAGEFSRYSEVSCNTPKRVECFIIREISRILNFKLMIINMEIDDIQNIPVELYLVYNIYQNYYPFHMDPHELRNVYFYIAYDKKYEQSGISTFLRPFSFNLWLALLSWIGISTISIIIVYYFLTNSLTTVLNGFYEPLESFLNQCGYDPPEKFPIRIATLASRLAALFIVPAYTGAILSFILIPIFKYPFENIKEFVEDGSYQLVYTDLNFITHVQLTNDEYLKTAFENFSVYIHSETAVDSFVDALQTICEDHTFTFLDLEIAPSTIEDIQKIKGCKLIQIPSPIIPSWLSIRLRHASPYLKVFNKILKTLRSSGVLKRIVDYSFVWIKKPKLITDYSEDEATAVTMENLKNIFTTIALLYLISVLIFIGEIIINKRKRIKFNLKLHWPF